MVHIVVVKDEETRQMLVNPCSTPRPTWSGIPDSVPWWQRPPFVRVRTERAVRNIWSTAITECSMDFFARDFDGISAGMLADAVRDGLDPDLEDGSDWSLLDMCVELGRADLVRVLIDAGAYIKRGRTNNLNEPITKVCACEFAREFLLGHEHLRPRVRRMWTWCARWAHIATTRRSQMTLGLTCAQKDGPATDPIYAWCTRSWWSA